jgi:hypothetical protein
MYVCSLRVCLETYLRVYACMYNLYVRERILCSALFKWQVFMYFGMNVLLAEAMSLSYIYL